MIWIILAGVRCVDVGFIDGIWGGERWNGEFSAEVSPLDVDLKNFEVEILRRVRMKKRRSDELKQCKECESLAHKHHSRQYTPTKKNPQSQESGSFQANLPKNVSPDPRTKE